MKGFSVFFVMLLAATLFTYGAKAEDLERGAVSLERPSDDMSARDLMRLDYVIKYTKFLEDSFINNCVISYVPRSGRTRVRRAQRFRITLNRPEDGLDYKDLVVITHPENVKGLAVMTWSYLDPERQRDQWLWLPSLKRVRRTSPAEGEDAFMGSDFTTEDATSRRLSDETYTKLPDENSPAYTLKRDGRVINDGVPCYVIECVPVRDPWYYSRRNVYLDRETGANIYEEIYDVEGNLARTIVREYEILPEGPIQRALEAYTLRTGHATHIDNDGYEVNTGLDESIFTERHLMRTSW